MNYRVAQTDQKIDPEPKRPPGRPAEIDEGRAVNVWLDAPSIKRAKALGGGSISAGIRRALELPAKSAS